MFLLQRYRGKGIRVLQAGPGQYFYVVSSILVLSLHIVH